jgi:TolA-binding protein
MDRITRKSLKDDRFAAEVTHSVEYLSEHRRQALTYGGIALVLLVALVGGYLYYQNRQSAAHEALYKALETYRAVVTEGERPGFVTYRTDQEKNEAALKAFQAVASGYSGAEEARVARYYLGLVYRDMGKLPEAAKELEGFIGGRTDKDEVTSLARLALADIYASEGKTSEARKHYEFLIQNPSTAVPEPRAQLAMARLLQKQQPEEARKLLQELTKRTGVAGVAATTMLRELGQP